MKLVTAKLKKALPPLYAMEDEPDPLVLAKYFLPYSHWTWYTIEFDGADLFFGYVAGDYPELGDFRLSELADIRDRFGLPIERDLYWDPVPLSEVKKIVNMR